MKTYTYCKVDDCEAEAHSKGYCSKHYARLKRTGTTDKLVQPRKHGHVCTVPGCGREQHSRGYCTMHYARKLRKGIIGPAGKTRRQAEYPCGTPQARRRHHRAGEPLCEACSVRMPKTETELRMMRAYRKRKAEEKRNPRPVPAKVGRPKGSKDGIWQRPFDTLEGLPPHLAGYIKARRARRLRANRIAAMKRNAS